MEGDAVVVEGEELEGEEEEEGDAGQIQDQESVETMMTTKLTLTTNQSGGKLEWGR